MLAQVILTANIVQLIVAVIIIAAACGIYQVASARFGWKLPGWLEQIVAIVIVAVVAIYALHFLLGLV